LNWKDLYAGQASCSAYCDASTPDALSSEQRRQPSGLMQEQQCSPPTSCLR
jgi:hypothetical protein